MTSKTTERYARILVKNIIGGVHMSDTTTTAKSSKFKKVTSTLKDAYVPDTTAGKIVAYATTLLGIGGSFILGTFNGKKKAAKK
jgi:uncharacterized membrane protein